LAVQGRSKLWLADWRAGGLAGRFFAQFFWWLQNAENVCPASGMSKHEVQAPASASHPNLKTAKPAQFAVCFRLTCCYNQ